jgi:DNA-binding transcriptional LysR family regulator
MFLDNTEHIINAIKRNEVNFGFIGIVVKDPSVTYHLFFQDQITVVIGPDTEIKKRTVSWKELNTLPFIGREKGSDIRTSYEQWFRKRDIQLIPMIILNNTEAIKVCIQNNIGFSLLPWCTVHQEVEAGLLRVVSIPYFDIHQNFYICHFKEKKFSESEKSFLKFLFDEIETKGILSSSEENTF